MLLRLQSQIQSQSDSLPWQQTYPWHVKSKMCDWVYKHPTKTLKRKSSEEHTIQNILPDMIIFIYKGKDYTMAQHSDQHMMTNQLSTVDRRKAATEWAMPTVKVVTHLSMHPCITQS